MSRVIIGTLADAANLPLAGSTLRFRATANSPPALPKAAVHALTLGPDAAYRLTLADGAYEVTLEHPTTGRITALGTLVVTAGPETDLMTLLGAESLEPSVAQHLLDQVVAARDEALASIDPVLQASAAAIAAQQLAEDASTAAAAAQAAAAIDRGLAQQAATQADQHRTDAEAAAETASASMQRAEIAAQAATTSEGATLQHAVRSEEAADRASSDAGRAETARAAAEAARTDAGMARTNAESAQRAALEAATLSGQSAAAAGQAATAADQARAEAQSAGENAALASTTAIEAAQSANANAQLAVSARNDAAEHAGVATQKAATTTEQADIAVQAALDAAIDRAQTALDAAATAADRVQTGLDKQATAADRVQTGADRTQTGLDKVQTGLDRAATAADRTQTSLDRAATGEDRTQTGLDRVAVEGIYDQFDDRYLGPKSVEPTLDNDGQPLVAGALYYNTASLEMRVFNGTVWETAYVPSSGVMPLIFASSEVRVDNTIFTGNLVLTPGTLDIPSGVTITVEADAQWIITGAGRSLLQYDSASGGWSSAAGPTGEIVGASDTQTLTNKTLEKPVINAPTITGGRIFNAEIVLQAAVWHSNTVEGEATIPEGCNAVSIPPVLIPSGAAVNVGAGSTWSFLSI